MNAARKFTDPDPALPRSKEPTSSAERVVHDAMLEAAGCEDFSRLDQIMRFRGSDLVAALEAIFEVWAEDPKPPIQTLESRLSEIGVRQNILDNLEIVRLHMARAHRTRDALDLSTEPSPVARKRLQNFDLARWEHTFGLTFLSLLASGAFPESAPGVDLMLGWMRQSSRNACVQAVALEDELRSAA